jgi:hypothetical protein
MPVALGRPLTRADERSDHPPVAVISQRLWEDRLGGDARVLGRSLILGARAELGVHIRTLQPDQNL